MIYDPHNHTYIQIIDLLRHARSDRGMTTRELAKQLALNHQFVSKIEKMERKLGVGEFVQYCAALGVDPIDILEMAIKRCASRPKM